MAGTKEGGEAAAETNKLKYGPDFYSRIGSKGGKESYRRGHLAAIGFKNNPERASAAGKKGRGLRHKAKQLTQDDSIIQA